MENISEPQFQEDWISKLPEDTLVDILSTFNLKEAAQTSVLSHRWLNLWTHVPRLHFVSALYRRPCSLKERKTYMHVFANWVNRVLDLRRSSCLREFRIICDLNKCYQNEIDKWLEYALGSGVQTLELNLNRLGFSLQPNDMYNFPNQLLRQTTKLGTQLAPKVGFSCLRELYFLAVNITGEAIECLLLKCPLLEDLRVIGSRVLVNLVVSGPSLLLKHLQITDCFRVESIKISDVNIVSLRLSTKQQGHRLIMLNNLPMLTEVWITGQFPNKSIFFSQLSCCLSQLTVLTLESVYPEVIMELYKFPELQNLRRLVLVTDGFYKSLIGLTSLIDSCPRLVEFALMVCLQINLMDDLTSYGEQRQATEESLKGLKVFEMYGYHGNQTYEDELMMFFIENAVALEKIVIDPRTIRTLYGVVPREDERAKESRTHALEKYKGLVPKQVELVIL